MTIIKTNKQKTKPTKKLKIKIKKQSDKQPFNWNRTQRFITYAFA